MRPRRQTGKSLKRARENRQELRTIVVFCEGVNSEPDYVNGLKKLPDVAGNTALNVEIHPKQGVPLTLVRMATARQRDDEVDECWCLFDVEWPKHHPHLPDALALADAEGIRLAISNPCFEVWLILHHEDFTRFENTAAVERVSRLLDKRVGKSIDAAVYMPLRRTAARRAALLDKHHASAGTEFPENNPSSGMYKFLEAVERA